MTKALDKFPFAAFCVISLAFYIVANLIIKANVGDADSYMHYIIARYSFSYPELLLDHWGKPIYTLLSAPFAQLGYKAHGFYNILMSAISAASVYAFLKKDRPQLAFAGWFFLLFFPVFLTVSGQSLTEITFATLFIGGVTLLKYDRIWIGAFVLSFLPVARTEGFFLMPLFAAWFVYRKHYLKLLGLGLGVAIYSIIGYFVFHDLFWLINKNPYTGAADLYGKGDWYRFIVLSDETFGKAGLALATIGSFLLLFRFRKSADHADAFLLIALPFFCYFGLHSYLWWSGKGGSMGLTRVMAAIAPAAGVLCAYAFSAFKSRMAFITALIPAMLLQVWMKPDYYRVLVQRSQVEQEIEELCTELKKHPIADSNCTYYLQPAVPVYLDLDPYQRWKCYELHKAADYDFKAGDRIIYDSKLGPQEARIPFYKLLSGNFILQDIKVPEQAFDVFGGRWFCLSVLSATKENHLLDNLLRLNQLNDQFKLKGVNVAIFDLSRFQKEDGRWTMNAESPFGEILEVNVPGCNKVFTNREVRGSVYLEKEEDLPKDLNLVMEARSSTGEMIYYKNQLFSSDKQQNEYFSTTLPAVQLNDNVSQVKVYLYSPSGQTNITKRLKIELL